MVKEGLPVAFVPTEDPRQKSRSLSEVAFLQLSSGKGAVHVGIQKNNARRLPITEGLPQRGLDHVFAAGQRLEPPGTANQVLDQPIDRDNGSCVQFHFHSRMS